MPYEFTGGTTIKADCDQLGRAEGLEGIAIAVRMAQTNDNMTKHAIAASGIAGATSCWNRCWKRAGGPSN